MNINLNGKWKLKDENGKIYDAIVPGCVHTDILRVDLNVRNNSQKGQFIENQEWEYSREFYIDNLQRGAVLVFNGLDTYCDVTLNNKLIGSYDNMFIPHEINVDDVLQIGKNTLKVYFYSPVKKVSGKKERRCAFSSGRLNTRRVQCTYGWDWVDRFVTCGIFKDTYIEFRNRFYIKDVYLYTTSVDSLGACIKVNIETENYSEGQIINISILSPQGEAIYNSKRYVDSSEISEYITVTSPEIWFPVGYGEQPLYTLNIEYSDKCFARKFGIRTVRIMENTDAAGSKYFEKCKEIKNGPGGLQYDKNDVFKGFLLLVNGIKIKCLGANYVPTEALISNETDKKITTLLEMAVSCGVNMIRIWGGGIFECKHFYSECDRLGIMIIHDFLMACGEYPEDEEWFLEALRKETEYAARLLRNHPCLMWWQGDNENAINGCDTDTAFPGRIASLHAISPVLERWDYTHRLLLSSPYGGNKYASKTFGTTHNTQYLEDTFNYLLESDMTDYKEYFGKFSARFISEEPAFGAICEASLTQFMPNDDIYGDDLSMWNYHTKTNSALNYTIFDLLLNCSKKVFGNFKDGYDRLFKLQYAQFETIRISMENCRSNSWFCGGILYWMLNDCWAAASGWAIIDYYCKPKAAFYSFKRCAKKILSVCKQDFVTLCNNKLINVSVKYKMYRVDIQENTHICFNESETVIPAEECTSISITEKLQSNELFVVDIYENDTVIDRSFYKNGKLLIEPTDKFEIKYITDDKAEITAKEYLQAVYIVTDEICEDNYFSLLKDETKTVSLNNISNNKIIAYKLTEN